MYTCIGGQKPDVPQARFLEYGRTVCPTCWRGFVETIAAFQGGKYRTPRGGANGI